MADAWVVALAVAAATGAWRAAPVPLALGVAVAVAGRLGRWPLVLCAGVALTASALGARAWDGVRPVERRVFDGVVTLAGDPQPRRAAVRVVVRTEHGRLEAWARGSPARRLSARLAGERVAVRGTITPPPPAVAHRLAVRHLRGRLQVEAVGGWHAGDPASRAANRLRRLLDHGARTLPAPERALFSGLVLGDDRAQPAADRDAFRAAGLSHLTAVSGQNVALVLTLVAPLLTRLRPAPRWAATVAVIGWFVLLTRFEPSVLRAGAMAAVAATAFALGRPASTVRLLGLAVTGLLLVDPFLVWSVGFWLSVGATAGIAGLAGPILARLGGPGRLASPVSVTAAAQVGVAPVSVLVFGGLPLVSVPANLLAVPAAAPVLLVGVPAAVVAAVTPDPLAVALLLPVHACLAWLRLVAHGAAALPMPAVAVLLAGTSWWWWAAGRRARRRPATTGPTTDPRTAAGSDPGGPPPTTDGRTAAG